MFEILDLTTSEGQAFSTSLIGLFWFSSLMMVSLSCVILFLGITF